MHKFVDDKILCDCAFSSEKAIKYLKLQRRVLGPCQTCTRGHSFEMLSANSTKSRNASNLVLTQNFSKN